jgi:hypothetical protein
MSSSIITVRPATLADSDAIATIHSEALSYYNDFYAAFFERHPRDLIPIATRIALQNPEVHSLVAEEAGETVGFIRYKDMTKKPEPNSNASDKPPPPQVWTIKDHMKDLWQWFDKRSEEMDASKEKALDGRDHFGEFVAN